MDKKMILSHENKRKKNIQMTMEARKSRLKNENEDHKNKGDQTPHRAVDNKIRPLTVSVNHNGDENDNYDIKWQQQLNT